MLKVHAPKCGCPSFSKYSSHMPLYSVFTCEADGLNKFSGLQS